MNRKPINIKIKWNGTVVTLEDHNSRIQLSGKFNGVEIWMRHRSGETYQAMVTIPDELSNRITEFTRINNGRAEVVSCQWVQE